MGWWFSQDDTKKDVIQKLIKDEENEVAKWTTVTHCLRGNILWIVREIFYKKENKTERYIQCSILGAQKDYGWGSKDMEESMGPCYHSCPLKYLDLVPEPKSEYSKEWRDRVRAYHNKLSFKLKIGMKVELENCKIPYVEITSIKPLQGKFDYVLYRISRRHIKGLWQADEGNWYINHMESKEVSKIT